MTQEELNAAIEADGYCKPREEIKEFDNRLYLQEVGARCPLCGKLLIDRKQKKKVKLFEIAHIYPNRPTEEQYRTLQGLPRLGNNSESYDNKIALCRDCHKIQDHHTTVEDYIQLLNIKKKCLQNTALNEATATLGLEDQICEVLKRLTTVKESELAELNYTPVPVAKKFSESELLLKIRVEGYAIRFYPLIYDIFKDMDGKNGFHMQILSGQIKSCFVKMNDVTSDKSKIFDYIVNWVKTKTSTQSKEACEIVVSYFVQNCEVFNEIAE